MKKLVKSGKDFGLALGEVIIGDIGFKDHVVFTALGGSVNVASRLQELTKSLNTRVVISDEVCAMAGIPSDTLTQHTVSIRGRDEQMMVRTAADVTALDSLVDGRTSTQCAELMDEPA